MSSPLDAKRRKLNNANSRLSKPFVSPLKTTTTRTPLKPVSNATNKHLPYTPSTLAHTISCTPTSPSSPPPRKTTTATTPARAPARKPALRTPFSKRSNPEEIALQKSITSLELRIKSVKNDLDTLNQAAKLLSDPTSADDLLNLTQKWQLASQTAAEELFASVKERVQRMGGVAAWRDSEKQKYDRQNGLGEFAEEDKVGDDDADCEFDSQGEELPEDEQEWRKSEKARVRREAEEAAEGEGRCEGEEGEEGGRKEVWMEGGGDDDVSYLFVLMGCWRLVV